MYILSKRKDYYDGVVGTVGIDKTIVYTREENIIDEHQIPVNLYKSKGRWSNDASPFEQIGDFKLDPKCKYKNFSTFIVGFCGKTYLGWKFYSEKKTRISSTYIMDELVTEIVYDSNIAKNYFVGRYWRDIKNWEEKFDEIVKQCNSADLMKFFREYDSPTFILDLDYEKMYFSKNNKTVKLIINGRLSDYEFYKVFDAFQAFQEISMFVSGVLGNKEKDIVVVEDKYKITQHGFDKWSFRKESTKK